MQCPNCQHWNEAGSRFCEECGTELTVAEDVLQQVQVRYDPSIPGAAPAPLPMPAPPVDEAAPVDAPEPAQPFSGPHLELKSSGSIFKFGDSAVLGREDPSLQIDFDGYPDGKYVSHRHAQVVKANGKYYIEDLGSSNSTWVNGIKLVQGQAEPIGDGDTIRLGKIELTFHES